MICVVDVRFIRQVYYVDFHLQIHVACLVDIEWRERGPRVCIEVYGKSGCNPLELLAIK